MYPKVENKTYPEKLFPVGLIFVIDIFLTAISFALSYFICSQFFPDITGHKLIIQLPIIIAITSFVFLFIGIYKGLVHYDQLRQVYSIFNAICLANILTIVLAVANGKIIMEADLAIPLSIIVVHSGLSFLALVFSRYLYKRILDFAKYKSSDLQKVLLVTDSQLINDESKNLIGYLEDNSFSVVGNQCFDLTEIGSQLDDKLPRDNSVKKVIVNLNTYSIDNLLQVLDTLVQFNLPIFLVQNQAQNPSRDGSIVYNLKRLDVSHLFPNQLNLSFENKNVKDNLNNKTLLITGAGGAIASETLKSLLKLGVKCKLILLDISEASLNSISTFCKNHEHVETISKLGDVKNNKLLKKIFKEFRPDYVLHCAGNNKPELVDNHIGNIFKENILATKQLADLAQQFNIEKFIFCSTIEAERPKTTLEVSKRVSELYLDGLNEKLGKNIFFSIRLNKVFNSNSSLINYLAFQISMGKLIEPNHFEGYKVFANKKDIAKSISYFLGTNKVTVGIVSLKLGTRIKTSTLVQFLKSLREQKNIQSAINVSISEGQPLFHVNDNHQNEKLLTQPPFEVVREKMPLSHQRIVQLIDNLCFNITMNEESFPEIFELISDFEPGEWADGLKDYRENKDGNNNRVITLN